MDAEFSLSRRSLLKAGAVAGAAAGLAGVPGVAGAQADEDTGVAPPRPAGSPGSMFGVPFDSYDQIRVGFVGVGNRGMSLLQRILGFPEARVTAICDVEPGRVQEAADRVVNAGQPAPALYAGRGGDWDTTLDHYEVAAERSRRVRSNGRGPSPGDADEDYRALCARDDVDLVVNATSWEWHHPVLMEAMLNGKHAATEVPLAMELDHLWDLVNTSEQTRRHCIMLGQAIYRRSELRLARMTHEGVFGDLFTASGGYESDIRPRLFTATGDTRNPSGWRRLWWTRRNGDFYSMHAIAPVSNWLGINSGDRFDTIVSMGSPSRGLELFREEHVPPDDESWDDPPYIKGDRTFSQIQTAKGRVIQVSHDETIPFPYNNKVHYLTGTRGSFRDFPPRIYLEPDHATGSDWFEFGDDFAEYDHWLLNTYGSGRNGDEHQFRRLFQNMRLGLAPDVDVYDSATWCVQIPLSFESIKRGSKPVKVPDFTRGQWDQRSISPILRDNPEA